MTQSISKSRFKPQALKYFRAVQETGRELVITERGQPVLKIVPYHPDPEEARKQLEGSVIRYDDPTEPVALEDWDLLS